jgi:NDP-sugar pyrophosphorylase family protein
MKAMILAAGLGTRLRPLTEKIPKPLLLVGGTPIIMRNLLLLRQHGIKDVMINLHHLGHMIEQALGDGSQWGMRIQYSVEPIILGTGGGIKAVEMFFEGEPFLVMNGDTLIELDLTELLEQHRTRGGVATMVLREDVAVERWGVIETSLDHRVLTILGRGQKPLSFNHPLLRFMFAGVHVINPQLLRHCPLGMPSSIIEGYIAELEGGALIQGFIAKGYWSDIGTEERLLQAQRDVEAGRISIPGEKPL